MELFSAKFTLLAVTAAAGYAIATIGMKLASGQWSALAVGFIALGLLAAVQAELILMRGVNLGVLYLSIIALETLLVLAYAFSIGEGLSFREAVGGGLVIAGLMVIAH